MQIAIAYEVASFQAGGRRLGLILTDLVMPQMDGMELLRMAKEPDTDIGVVMLTGYTSVDTAAGCMKLGAYDYIARPFRIAEIVARAEEALHKHRQNRQVV